MTAAATSVVHQQSPTSAPPQPYTQPVHSQPIGTTASIPRSEPANPGMTAAGQPSSAIQTQAGTRLATNAVQANANTSQTTSMSTSAITRHSPPSARSQPSQPSIAPSGRAGAQPMQNTSTSASQRNEGSAAQPSRTRRNNATSRRTTQQLSMTPEQAPTQQNTRVTDRRNTNGGNATPQDTLPDLTDSEVTILFKCCDELFRHYEQGRKFWMRVEARLSVRIGRVYPWQLCKNVVLARVKKRLAEKAKFPRGYKEQPLSRVNKAIDKWIEWLGWRAYEENLWDPSLVRREEDLDELQYDRREFLKTASQLMEEILNRHREPHQERGTKRPRNEVDDSDSDNAPRPPPPWNSQVNMPSSQVGSTPAGQQQPVRDGRDIARPLPGAQETRRAQERDKSVEVVDERSSQQPISLGSNRTRADIEKWIEGVISSLSQPVHDNIGVHNDADNAVIDSNVTDNNGAENNGAREAATNSAITNNAQQRRETCQTENHTSTEQPKNMDRAAAKEVVNELKAEVLQISMTLSKMSQILDNISNRLEKNYPSSDRVHEAAAS